jgi:succinate dehydrogenase / fumarate reductase membrane anchor subunit
MTLLTGQRAFVVQRLSALLLLAYVAAAALRLAFGPPPGFAQWQAWIAHPLGASLLLLLTAAILGHAWVGLRDVVLDYVRPLSLRFAVLALAVTSLALLGLWTTLIVIFHAL